MSHKTFGISYEWSEFTDFLLTPWAPYAPSRSQANANKYFLFHAHYGDPDLVSAPA